MTASAEHTERTKPRRREIVKAALTADRTPMWFTLLALMAGAAGTYFVAPRVNAEFEAQKIKTDFVIRNFNDLRQKMEDFQGTFVIASQKVAAGEPAREDVSKLQELIARVGAQNISMMPVFTTANGPRAAGEVTVAMNGMVNVLFANAGKVAETPEQVEAFSAEVGKASQALIKPLLELYVEIGKVGRLQPTETSTDLKEE